MSQESKDLVSSLLLMPFLRKQTLKSIGEGIDALAERLVRYTADDEEGNDIVGQDISQIAYLGKGVYIDDVRLLQTYSQVGTDEQPAREPDELLL